MAQDALINALRRQSEGTAREVWRQAEEQVAERRAALEAGREERRVRSERELAAEIAGLRGAQLDAARRRARKDCLLAEQELADRLAALAREMLAELGADREALWKSLVAELPEAHWTRVRVHPDDAERARRDLPTAEVDEDAVAGGGLAVATAGDALRVDNTLAIRLARAWDDLLPVLLEELCPAEEPT